jgi:hypothetical protein
MSLINPKFEYRNPKQYQNSMFKIQNKSSKLFAVIVFVLVI